MVNLTKTDSIKSGSCEQQKKGVWGGRGRGQGTEGMKEEEVEQERKKRKEKNIQKS